MTLTVVHRFTSPKTDGPDSTLVKPSNWNDTHDLETDSVVPVVLGALGAGPIVDMPIGNLFPTGTVLDFAGSTLPGGYQWANGQAISRTTFAALFAVIGTTYGTGDGSTTFNVPDLRGRVVAGMDIIGGSANAARIGSIVLGAGVGTNINSAGVTVSGSLGGSGSTFGSLSVGGSFSGSGGYIGGSITDCSPSGGVATVGPDVVIGVSGSISGGTGGSLGVSVGVSGSLGGGTNNFSIVQPTMVMNKIIKS